MDNGHNNDHTNNFFWATTYWNEPPLTEIFYKLVCINAKFTAPAGYHESGYFDERICCNIELEVGDVLKDNVSCSLICD